MVKNKKIERNGKDDYATYLTKYPDNFRRMSFEDVIIHATDPMTGRKEVVRVPRPTYTYLEDALSFSRLQLREAMQDAGVNEYVASFTKDPAPFLTSLAILDKKLKRLWELETLAVDLKCIRPERARKELDTIVASLTVQMSGVHGNSSLTRTFVDNVIRARQKAHIEAMETTTPPADNAVVILDAEGYKKTNP
eukprot:gene29457-5802_t